MQTFLPYASFQRSAKCLDYKRLGKQRVEAWQIYQVLIGKTNGWKTHPAVRMWTWNQNALLRYGYAICEEWISRGYKDTMLERFEKELDHSSHRCPYWLGAEGFHKSHRSNLLRKDPIWYGQFGWTEPNNLEYVWPESGAYHMGDYDEVLPGIDFSVPNRITPEINYSPVRWVVNGI